jgi:predicted pyridoxine 5'-phosphate oxidase superfamily flavin-nucleotide-binding protein
MDIAFTPAVKAIQSAKGSRQAYAKVEARGGFATEVTEDLGGFLAQIDTAFLATANADGQPYIQHRGGAKGFIRVLDNHTIGFLELGGNKQYVTTGNLTENDRVCLFLIDYATRQRVKVWGTARTVPVTPELATQLGPTPRGSRVEHAVLITVSAWDINCPQHIPVKIDADDVRALVERYESRIASLEAELGTVSIPSTLK